MNILKKELLQPKNKDELIRFIKDEIEKNGNECDLNHIDTSLITDMSGIFSLYFRDFNGNISQWDTSNVTIMESMFASSSFNGDISQWNTSSVIIMAGMFWESQFNQDISKWDTQKVQDMSHMFCNSRFNQDISQWNTSNVKNMDFMFSNSRFNQDISQWSTSKVINIFRMFKNSQITKIPQWNYFSIDDVSDCFNNCSFLSEPLPDWYQFSHIDNAQNRKTAYDDYLKSKNLSIKNNSVKKFK